MGYVILLWHSLSLPYNYFAAESTDEESDNEIQRYSKRPRQLSKFCLADYVSKVDIIFAKGNKIPEKRNDRYDDESCDSSYSDENEDFLDDGNSQSSDMLYRAKKRNKIQEKKSTMSN